MTTQNTSHQPRALNATEVDAVSGAAAAMIDMGLFTPDWNFIIPKRPALLERYNQVFSS